MNRCLGSALLLGLLLGIACKRDGSPGSTAPDGAPGLQPPALVVLLVVDQLRGDELERYEPLFRYGLRRLMNEGRRYQAAYHGHARTETATGHATIATGVYPRVHGVVDKRMYDQQRRQLLGVCDFGSQACSAEVLRVPTLGDRLKEKYPGAQVVSMAQKDRSAMLLGGKRADLVTWVDAETWALEGRWAGQEGTPSWLERAFQRYAAPDRINRIWELPRLPSPFKEIDDEGEGEIEIGIGIAFPHEIPQSAKGAQAYWMWTTTPDADRALVELAIDVRRRLKLGEDDSPDLLALSLGAFDAIGHTFGPDSLERVAAFVALDRMLGDFISAVEDEVGKSWVLALSSDHGVDAVPHGGHGDALNGRLSVRALEQHVRLALEPRFGQEIIASLSFPFLTLSGQASDGRGEYKKQINKELLQVAIQALEAHPAVHRAFSCDAVSPDASDELERLVAQNVFPGRSGHVAIVLERHHALISKYRGKRGAEHGSPWPYDRHVPLILWGEGIQAGQVEQKVAVIDLIRTLSDRLGLAAVAQGGRPLP